MPNPATNWPMEPRRLLEDPSPENIHDSAIWQISRALNDGRVTAFVGAGVSMAYGRMSWRELVKMLSRGIIADHDRSGDGQHAELRNRVERINNHEVGSDQYPGLFLLAKLLDDKLLEHERLNRPPPHRAMEAVMRGAIHDDRGQAQQLLMEEFRKAIQVSTDPQEYEKRSDMLFGRDKDFNPTRAWLDDEPTWRDKRDPRSNFYTYRLAFSARRASKLTGCLEIDPSVPEPCLKLARALCRVPVVRDGQPVIGALHRFVLPALLYLQRDVNAAHQDLCEEVRCEAEASHLGGASSRADTIPAERDPLLILHRNLGVERFLTTNYDLELERLYRDLGYGEEPFVKHGDARAASARTDRIDALGGRARDTVVTKEGHGLLLDFATQDQHGRPQVVHLHGRATDGDTMLVTERDYQELYQRDDRNRRPMDVARRLTFASNPLLFVGLGMTEDDILRPQRQFMAQDTRLGDRLAVAVMPGLYRGAKRELEQMALLNRYGVHAIYTGAAGFQAPDDCSNWLACVLETADAVLAAIKALSRTAVADATRCWDQRPARTIKEGDPDSRTISFAHVGSRLVVPGWLDGIRSDRFLAFEIGVLNACIEIVDGVCTSATTGAPPWTPNAAQCRAIEVAVEGVKSALITACLCARLQRLQQQWCAWKTDRFKVPEPRPPSWMVTTTSSAAGQEHWLVGHDEMPIVYRHVVSVPLERAVEPQQRVHRFHQRPQQPSRPAKPLPSHGIEQFQRGLRQSGPAVWQGWKGRRIFLLLARPGVGKGHAFAALTSRPGLARFVAASWGYDADKPCPTKPASYVAALCVNLGFSHEVASVFDRLAWFLETYWARVYPLRPGWDPNAADWNTLHAEHAQIVKHLGTERHDRHDRHGRLLALLDLYRRSQALLPDGSHPGAHFRLIVSISNISALYDPSGDPKNAGLGRMFDWFIGEQARHIPVDLVLLCSTEAVPRTFRATAPDRGSVALVYPDDTTPSHLRTIHEHLRSLGLGSIPRPNEMMRSAPAGRAAQSDVIVVHLLRRAPVAMLAGAFFPRVAAAVASDVRGGRSDPWSGQPHSAADFTDLSDTVITAIQDTTNSVPNGVEECIYGAMGGTAKACPREFAPALSNRLRKFAKAVGKRRLAATLLLAAADEQIGPLADGLPTQNARRAVDFLDGAEQSLAGVAHLNQAAAVMDIVLAAMERRHRERQLPPIALQTIKRLGPALHQLLLQILWHLAIVGDPVGCDVLLACPDIRTALGDVTAAGQEFCGKTDRTDPVLQDAISLLIHRCLVMEVAPRMGADNPVRYGVSRLVQRYIIRLLDAPLGDYRALDRYSLSLYYSQPGDLPRPSLEAHHRLRRLVIGLSGYEGAEEGPAPKLMALRLRAAMGVLASVYHVAILSRFDVYGSDDTARYPGLGHFESHRQLVLWLIHQARLLAPHFATGVHDRPFYAGELVWLYNEAGLLGLAQGRVAEATVLFQLALDTVRTYIAPNDAALYARITLNHAVAAIEQGDAVRARERLARILGMDGESRIIKAIAEGLIGWIDHLGGDLETAKAVYQRVIPLLRAAERGRPAALFTQRLGDLERALGRFVEAAQHLDTAENLARQGAHEDVVQFVRLSRVRLMIERADPADLVAAQATLDNIEAYGRNVGLMRIQIEVACTRAELVLRQGEHRQATELAAEALHGAILHDLRTYKSRAAAVLSRALRAEGVPETADLLRTRAEEIARRSGYTILAKRLQDEAGGGAVSHAH